MGKGPTRELWQALLLMFAGIIVLCAIPAAGVLGAAIFLVLIGELP